jgi:hypothetical protein
MHALKLYPKINMHYGNVIVHATRHITHIVANVSMGNIGTRGQKT